MGTVANASDEWIELFNSGDVSADLTGWSLFEGGTHIIGLVGSIEPGGYYLVERTDDTTVSDITAGVFGPFGGSGLSNAGEDLRLENGTGVIVDEVPCASGWFAGDAASKTTMERISPWADGSDPSNWATHTGADYGQDAKGNPINGTPGARNSVQI